LKTTFEKYTNRQKVSKNYSCFSASGEMIMEISKKDWKVFREKLPRWQENYMEGIIKDYAVLLSDNSKTASDKFWELEKRIKADKKHPGVIMTVQKSETIWNIAYLIRLKVITYDDLVDFSDELKQEVKRILEINHE
jgi:hypothetical protein